jgi:hypothetical protein
MNYVNDTPIDMECGLSTFKVRSSNAARASIAEGVRAIIKTYDGAGWPLAGSPPKTSLSEGYRPF